jgi:hypothetical protein
MPSIWWHFGLGRRRENIALLYIKAAEHSGLFHG